MKNCDFDGFYRGLVEREPRLDGSVNAETAARHLYTDLSKYPKMPRAYRQLVIDTFLGGYSTGHLDGRFAAADAILDLIREHQFDRRRSL